MLLKTILLDLLPRCTLPGPPSMWSNLESSTEARCVLLDVVSKPLAPTPYVLRIVVLGGEDDDLIGDR